MKIVTASNGKTQIKISKKEWESMGKKAGWMKKAQSEDFTNFMDSLNSDNPAKLKPAIRMIIKDGGLYPEREFDKTKLDQILGKHEFNAQPETIKGLAKKLWYGIEGLLSDQTSGYSLIVDGKGVNW